MSAPSESVTAPEPISPEAAEAAAEKPAKKRGPSLYVQVLVAIVLGVLLGWLSPEWGIKMKPLGDGFVKLIKMLIGPIVFTTVTFLPSIPRMETEPAIRLET